MCSDALQRRSACQPELLTGEVGADAGASSVDAWGPGQTAGLPVAMAAAAERRARILQRAPQAPTLRERERAPLAAAQVAWPSGKASVPHSQHKMAGPQAAAHAAVAASLARGRPGAYASPYSRQALWRGGAVHGRMRR